MSSKFPPVLLSTSHLSGSALLEAVQLPKYTSSPAATEVVVSETQHPENITKATNTGKIKHSAFFITIFLKHISDFSYPNIRQIYPFSFFKQKNKPAEASIKMKVKHVIKTKEQ
jgi:hypothetical protein